MAAYFLNNQVVAEGSMFFMKSALTSLLCDLQGKMHEMDTSDGVQCREMLLMLVRGVHALIICGPFALHMQDIPFIALPIAGNVLLAECEQSEMGDDHDRSGERCYNQCEQIGSQ